MNVTNEIEIKPASDKHRQAIVSLLKSENLPTEDLPIAMKDFFVAISANNLIGAIGLERFNKYGLLRSMIVDKAYRNKSIASGLVEALESKATELGIDDMFLLTETAPIYFEHKGYVRINRDEVPEPLKASSEFSNVCPVSAIVMKKRITKA